ncbi:MAG: hypothetical protein IKU29_11830 [Parabacteroides sp.]|nr:hypothetical protein [Parabacteroides sp.]
MNVEQLTQKTIEHEAKLAAYGEDLKTLFAQQQDIRILTESTKDLAISVRDVATKINDMDDRLEVIEQDKRQKGFAIWQIIVSAILGGALTYLVTLALK